MTRFLTNFSLIRLLRPRQWIKNTFVLAPLVFAGGINNIELVSNSLYATFLFCIASSATYILNDYKDIDSDKKHPIKSKTRPLASGEVHPRHALILMSLLYSTVVVSMFYSPYVTSIIIGYLILNVAYTLYLKHQPVLDIFSIAIGFVLRVYAGATAIGVPLSSWMFITTLALALYLAAVKRKQELTFTGRSSRKVLKHYNVDLVDKYAEMSASCALLFYSLFVISDKPQLVFTIPFVIFGIFRYWFVTSKGEGESPTDALFSDFQLQLTILFWVLASAYQLHP
ncbi:decaprenyl-phosphate phosphoribosyltransferase [Vibrio coralliilyticus]|uniref:decaprenyl-phosphate phosphoribosyltransferase n=1 Tax=Vibrio coralliilyticus TaxID=190893 RepID=UPI0006CC543D|nr:decaprenyl-phosphate phosphoribosyltransferase [Vibrio coralliilyticus]AXN31880.1 decaprenyl-phosphate phosphoribosyltransferase [Vibrio coralliilyticus]KPH26587.1 phosphoribose diphosphate:decaprenyl-phosphate phosphoribosyltransferase [Vibrio coralliilyticus]